jgi:hypothetical protein
MTSLSSEQPLKQNNPMLSTDGGIDIDLNSRHW